jgi:hypothetical protein
MVKILFHTTQIDVRGTCNALYYYAHYNEKILNNESYILTQINNPKTDTIAFVKFNNRFKIHFYNANNKEEVQDIIDRNGFDILYNIKYGKNDGFLFKNIKNVVHYVFDATEPHGDVFAGVSETLSNKFGKSLYVPHMIGLEPSKTGDNLRKSLKIPENATVFGRYGGMDTFNLEEVYRAIRKVVRDFDNIYFVFINTPMFDNHNQVIFLDKIINDDDKNKFIHTCDAHLECSSLGHTFGLSIGEFSVNNKPIIAYNGHVWNRCHLDILRDKGIYFKTEDELYNILTTFDKNKYVETDLNCYKEFSPDKIMKKFKEVFID